MSLQLMIGRSGSGKSQKMLDQIKSRLQQDPLGPPLILLVPEQGTFQIEHALASSPELRGTVRAQVLGFRRLALRVMQETGGSALIPISEEGKKMLLYKILRRLQSELKMYGNSGSQMGLVDKLNSLFTEAKKYGADPQGFQEHLGLLEGLEAESPLLKDKMHDLTLIYSEFEKELAGLYIDAEDHVIKLAEGAPLSAYLRDAEIWVDGFHTFTPQEYKALGAMLKSVSSLKVALTLDRPYDDGLPPHELNLFHPTATTYLKLKALAESCGVPVLETDNLNQRPFPRFKASRTLQLLEGAYERRTRVVEEPEDLKRSLMLRAASSRRAEVEAAVREMVRLAREEGARWRDMAIFVRSLDDYDHIAAPVFQDYGVPYFLDQRKSVVHHPLLEFIRASLDVIRRYWKYEDVFRMVKTDFLLPADGSLTREDMDVLENYVLASGIEGSRWSSDKVWKGTPRLSLDPGENTSGETQAKTETEAEASMERIWRCREAITLPLGLFEKRIKRAKTAEQMCTAVYHLLEDVGAASRLDLLAHQAVQEGQPQQAMEHRSLWGAILDMLDQIVEMMGDEELGLELFAGVLDTGLQDLKLGLVPPSLDQVLIGTTDRTRSSHVKHVFLLGINEGIMPAVFQEEGVLTDQELGRLEEGGLTLGSRITRKLLDERFLIYHALSSAACSLWISYPVADEEGKALHPSEVIRHVRAIFPALEEQFISEVLAVNAHEELLLSSLSRPLPGLSQLIGQLRQWKNGVDISQVWWEALQWYRSQPDWKEPLQHLLYSLDYRNATRNLTPDTSRKLYGKRLRTSVSRMERFAACPFSHFASHGLKLRERQLYRLKAPDIGQLFHAALSAMAVTLKQENRSWGSLTPEECMREAEAAVDKLAPKLQGEILLSSKRYGYISRKLKHIVGRASVILGEQSRRGDFEPVGLELDFGPGRELPPLRFELQNGCVMEIVGRIDRVDMAESEDGLLLRVIDYKSSQTDLKLHEVYYGLALQMLTYLDVILTSAEAWLGQSALPAGTLYFHVHNPLLQSTNAMDPEQARQEMLRRFKMRGLLLADRETIGKMDRELEKGYSDILPVAVKADGGFYSSAAVATLDQWTALLGVVRTKIKAIGTRITDGDVAIEPYRIGQETACTFCSYKSVCQFDEKTDQGRYKMLSKPGKEQMWTKIEEESPWSL
ncbi:helicase-exonuclease AddAB subunit AddB [Paenibacillus sp. CAA11]|uniref:helicase-exonuclease AddAB subunit AddB n=1 Tax=Paenibacillus sp. CAA11 TaxID=1532905 RepID=UPI000D333D6F|nr:helicase-exonuclease AddAB subunit AddB [Paenibacillus sp. CAA11]AWB45415.1 helicase-exonuclease AddAB subunit AddB [Paenibacillus sp. CAA11]